MKIAPQIRLLTTLKTPKQTKIHKKIRQKMKIMEDSRGLTTPRALKTVVKIVGLLV